MEKREENMENINKVFWICESCGKREYSELVK